MESTADAKLRTLKVLAVPRKNIRIYLARRQGAGKPIAGLQPKWTMIDGDDEFRATDHRSRRESVSLSHGSGCVPRGLCNIASFNWSLKKFLSRRFY
jgi:hypothetical protein